MSYTGQLKATLPDGSPMKGNIEIVVTSSRRGGYYGYGYYRNGYKELFRKRFKVPVNGVVDFIVPGSEIPSTVKLLSLKAKYKNKSLAYHDPKHWHSPSNSYISLERIITPLKVGSIAKVMFDFTTNTETKNIDFHYQIFCRGKLVAQGRKLHAVDYQPSMKTSKNSKNEEMFTSRGFIEFVVTQKMVPSCRLLLFHVRDDREIVADNMLIDVEDTLENKVDVRFAESIRKPGEPTRLIITAAPGSQVAVTAVDKSVHLLKGGNELTQDDAINVLSSQDVGPSRRYRRNLCGYQPHWVRWDASKAFKDSGIIYFSDLTVKCERPVNYYSYLHYRWKSGRARPLLASAKSRGPQATGRPIVTPKKKQETKSKPLNIRKEFPRHGSGQRKLSTSYREDGELKLRFLTR
ncbi:C3 and PZP-like alpha-2-macroglobulin domain-containing protein 8 [Desmophyllum pertusum]|uniref:C3 and PZP-like alpha-2-macroglobulin domain-containing protein 8 n=1 Tax=Desmophyllum pertusum TaxID=174260 RepID=A0A9X0CPQ7_9CNID|nr:C3 and PZP-like alpha-2-macroglobulin domain-containing protein 8 [Desmophyllum pertusum]